MALPPELLKELRSVLSGCAAAADYDKLHFLFLDQRIAFWWDRIAHENTPQNQVDALIATLHDQQNSNGQPALALFLQVAQDRFSAQDNCHARLAAALTAYTQQIRPSPPLLPPNPRPAVYWYEPYGEPDWVPIPAGTFWRGSKEQNNEKPVRKIYLDSYALARTATTNAQYALFVQATSYRSPKHWREGKIPPGRENHPVVYVSWQDAIAYCVWLSQVTGKSISLPTEAQWEKGARGSQDQRPYPWGDVFRPSCANTVEGGKGDTTPVGAYPRGKSPYGLLDMAGNVWEWVEDWYGADYYAQSPDKNPLGPVKGEFRVLRGGSWGSNADGVRASYRYIFSPTYRYSYFGFRCAQEGFSP